MSKRTIDDYIEAGAWYRIWKEISVHSSIVLSNNFEGISARKINSAYNKVNALECDCDFEKLLRLDFPDVNGLTAFFYGGIEVRKSGDYGDAVSDKIIEILEDLLNKAKENRHEDI